jgi:two-component system KDP operon response regulator KdpE
VPTSFWPGYGLFGDLLVDLARQRVFVRGQEVNLTPTEYRLLCELVRQAGRVLVPEYLLEKVWGIGYEGENRLLWQAVHRLRRKIEHDPRNPRHIQTRPGIGYVFAFPQ